MKRYSWPTIRARTSKPPARRYIPTEYSARAAKAEYLPTFPSPETRTCRRVRHDRDPRRVRRSRNIEHSDFSGRQSSRRCARSECATGAKPPAPRKSACPGRFGCPHRIFEFGIVSPAGQVAKSNIDLAQQSLAQSREIVSPRVSRTASKNWTNSGQRKPSPARTNNTSRAFIALTTPRFLSLGPWAPRRRCGQSLFQRKIIYGTEEQTWRSPPIRRRKIRRLPQGLWYPRLIRPRSHRRLAQRIHASRSFRARMYIGVVLILALLVGAFFAWRLLYELRIHGRRRSRWPPDAPQRAHFRLRQQSQRGRQSVRRRRHRSR